jgi:hypothetical protein
MSNPSSVGPLGTLVWVLRNLLVAAGVGSGERFEGWRTGGGGLIWVGGGACGAAEGEAFGGSFWGDGGEVLTVAMGCRDSGV